MSVKLKDINFELIYLGLLTKELVKPLSRWEKEFGPREIQTLKYLGLKTNIVERLLESGKMVQELTFAKNKELLDEYSNVFMKKPVQSTPEIVKLEGEFFGYPDCCVRSYINYGELNNGLTKDEQDLLFHWACPDCSVTPELIPQYRAIYEEAKRLKGKVEFHKIRIRQMLKMIPAVGLAAFIFIAGCDFSSSGKSHLIQLENDWDQDYLKDEWEEPLKLNPYKFDTDGNRIPDGIQLAQEMYDKTQNPPNYIKIDEHFFWGSYTCSKCGKVFNMGGLSLINTKTNDTAYVRFLALHYMEHGSFAYEGEEAQASGIVNPVQLDSLLSE